MSPLHVIVVELVVAALALGAGLWLRAWRLRPVCVNASCAKCRSGEPCQ